MNTKKLIALGSIFAFLSLAADLKAGSEKSSEITVTGCLQNSGNPNSWVLNVRSQGAERGSNESGQVPSELARSEPSYVLVPEGVNLARFEGKKVRVNGKLAKQGTPSDWVASRMGEAATMPANSDFNGEINESSSITSQYELRVWSIQEVSGTCR